ncbi:hypothetical protein DPMN_077773 [Dreissena polymorpha]|uniref:Uncharacterized protein n=1 Tax=Dreissena polymorpha TaxID=45954 RepID=A0A9D3YLI6_DREPO|nr:hypothetical protein DPMN_077773 [Dreissena polymorpha]
MKTNTDKPNDGEEREIDDDHKLDNPVDNHSYFILEKVPQSYESNADHYNATEETDDANNETDNYNSIVDTEERYERVQDDNGDYDYRTNALSSVNNNHKSDNIYNKLKINGLGEYDHVGIRGHSDAKVSGVDYDTTSARLDNGKNAGSDYNHIPHTAHKAGATYTDIKSGEYEATYGMKIKVVRSDGSDYAHVNKY